ncbi:MAG TPA: haloacid dehalogenase-like hydrolase, partial [Xanthobacteraceae bacterium]|nr:haloacid dehalogenase-like hydrolase [Xanthobacteraceae bacterium]
MTALRIVSASPEIAVRTAMGRFGLAGNLIALRHRLDHAVLTHTLDEPHSIAEGKVDCIKRHIDVSRRLLFAVGDSVYDLPIAQRCVSKDHALWELNRWALARMPTATAPGIAANEVPVAARAAVAAQAMDTKASAKV